MEANSRPKYPGTKITTNGNQLVSYYTEARLAEAGVFYPITPSTEMGENFQLSFAQGELNVFGDAKIAIETEGEHAAQGGAIAASTAGKRVVNFTSGQGVVYGVEQYYHAPGKLSTMVLEVSARALTKSALNVHCGHDDIYSLLDTGWTVLFAKDAQQASDQALILRRVNELALNPGVNAQDGFLTSHLERTFRKPEAELIREFLGRPDDIIDCPTEAQKELFGPKRRRVPVMYDITNPLLLGPVQNQEHYMNGVAARRNNFIEHILAFLEEAYRDFAALTGRHYGLISEYNCQNAETVFIAIGSAAENIEAAVDYIKQTKNEEVGVIHVNVIRPFPEKAIINALKGKKRVIILERSDDQTAGGAALSRDIKTALFKAMANGNGKTYEGLPAISREEMPRIFSGIYGLGSRDFRPEGILGAYEYAMGRIKRQDGKGIEDGASFFYVGINHPYDVIAKETPSFLPENSIAVRMHSIGGWGAITTGKNLGEIIGELSTYIATRDKRIDAETGLPEEVYHISANPKYGSEKKGAPTNYFLVAAPERIRVNCDLQHVDIVLCPDPKAFTHTNPLQGMKPGGVLIIETSETDSEKMWQRIPAKYRQDIIDKKIRIFGLSGFKIAKDATEREDLQYRMQGNAFLGAFFKVSPFLKENKIPDAEFLETVEAQYNKKFGRFGENVVQSNMVVMKAGFESVWEVKYGPVDAPDRSSMRGPAYASLIGHDRFAIDNSESKAKQPQKSPLFTRTKYDSEFRAGLGYHQPASALASTGAMAAATGATVSKYVARRMVPIWNAENCTQCLECINVCPDTALPNTVQDIDVVLKAAIKNFVSNDTAKDYLSKKVPELEKVVRQRMNDELAVKGKAPASFSTIVKDELTKLISNNGGNSQAEIAKGKEELDLILDKVPWAYAKARPAFAMLEKKETGSGGIFSIMVSDLCKGCGECVIACGDHNALEMIEETEEINGDHTTGVNFLDVLQDTPAKFLGNYDSDSPELTKAAVLQNHLMIRSNYEALVAGDGACAGCGEKSVLRATVTITEAFMRCLYHKKADRIESKVVQLQNKAQVALDEFKAKNPEGYKWWATTVKHTLLNLGGENEKDSLDRINSQFKGSDKDLIEAISKVMEVDAFNHRDLQAVEGRAANGMSVMGMTGHTGCNSVYGSTHPNNPHQYPWMNSLFQDGITIGWLLGETMIMDHAKRSVIPERLADVLLDKDFDFTEEDYFTFTHFTDANMTELEVTELPKIWAVGGDGGLGDIGFQNLSKAVLQNRPNVQVLFLDTHVYSNTGGQNSDSSVMPGGFDMNQFGKATEGKLTERKEVAAILMSGHGSPFVAQVSMANSPGLYRAIMDGLVYRGTAFFQCFTSCQPEHGIGDDMSASQAKIVRDSRCMPEFVFNPSNGESFIESLSLKGNPDLKRDWQQKTVPGTKDKYNYTVAHWATSEARFRRHFFKVSAEETKNMIVLDDILAKITQNDVVNRRFLDKNHRSFIPKKGVYILVEKGDKMVPMGISRHLVLFAVERRKNWRMMQSYVGIENQDYLQQKEYLKRLDSK